MVLPGMFTIANGLFGFSAILVATRHEELLSANFENLALAAWLIFAAMFCDMLDGRIARMTHQTTDFGAQLDSACDVISAGVAPAVIMLRTVNVALGDTGIIITPFLQRAIWTVAAVYVACACLRLARFNVETEPDEESHLEFKGLPSPAAAAVVVSLVLLLNHLRFPASQGLFSNTFTHVWFTGTDAMLITASVVLSSATLICALLMVSQFRYIHLANSYMRGKKRFDFLVKIVITVVIMFLEPILAIAMATVFFALMGPLGALKRKLHRS